MTTFVIDGEQLVIQDGHIRLNSIDKVDAIGRHGFYQSGHSFTESQKQMIDDTEFHVAGISYSPTKIAISPFSLFDSFIAPGTPLTCDAD